VSSERFKKEIKPMDKTSEAILALKPVTFRYKPELDPEGIPQFGLVAEDVEKVNPDLVARDDHGKPYSVRYEAVNAMLLNEFLKEHRKVEQLEKRVEALTASLQKVSAQLELSKASPQITATNQ
jgi:Chaperone of endosialidase